MAGIEISGVFIDMDGTIIDSEPYWAAAEQDLVESFGGRWSDKDGLSLVGSSLENAATKLQFAGVKKDIPEIIERMTHKVLEQLRDKVPWRPGILDFVSSLHKAEIPCALVTNSTSSLADEVARALEQRLESPFFCAIVSSDDVDRPKPDPEAYLRAAEILGIEPNRAVAIEDSVAGARSAYESGAVTIGVPLQVNIPRESVHVIWESFNGKSAEDVEKVWVEHCQGTC